MRDKFVQIVSFMLCAALLLPVRTLAADDGPEYDGQEEWTETGEAVDMDGEQPEDGETGSGLPEGEGPDAEAPELYAGIDAKVMRIGVYYGTAGKKSVELKLIRGDGFLFGTFDGENRFVPAEDAQPAAVSSVTVRTGSTRFGFEVLETATGALLYSFDDLGKGTGMAVQPYSSAGESTVTKCGYAYYGSFRFERFTANNELMTIVNYVKMGDYLKGVVPYEMSPSWPLEALKAQAVAARTYALTRISASHQNSYHFDLCDSVHCQAYKGVYSGSYSGVVDAAVEETSGVTVQYEGKYCQTVYSASNGGASESNENVNGSKFPYLVGKIDPYEEYLADSIPNYRWSVSFTGEQLQKKLAADYKNPGRIVGIKTSLSNTGNVIALTFLDENGKSYTKYRSSCRTFLSLNSIRYTVSSEKGVAVESGALVDTGGRTLDFSRGVQVIDGGGNVSTVTGGSMITAEGLQEIDLSAQNTSTTSGTVFTFSGSGWGHNVGMSQWGANAMARQGYTFQEILEFYYTGVTVG